MIIALDIDGTYSRDMDFWDLFITSASAKGHQIVVVTMRYLHETDDCTARLAKKATLYFTGHKAKRPFMYQQGIHIDVWIDDMPEFVVTDAAN